MKGESYLFIEVYVILSFTVDTGCVIAQWASKIDHFKNQINTLDMQILS